jgi:hypothetical protein
MGSCLQALGRMVMQTGIDPDKLMGRGGGGGVPIVTH